jgi:hypothetical protein
MAARWKHWVTGKPVERSRPKDPKVAASRTRTGFGPAGEPTPGALAASVERGFSGTHIPTRTQLGKVDALASAGARRPLRQEGERATVSTEASRPLRQEGERVTVLPE